MPHADQVRIHSRWRSGWSSGRNAYAWLLPMADRDGLRRLVNSYQYALRDLPGFDPVPLEWMHILVQEVGFTDEIDDAQVEALLGAARNRLSVESPLDLTFKDAVVLPESLALPAEPADALAALRRALREVTTATVGNDIPAEPEETDRHVSLAYSTADGPAVFAAATLAGTPVEAVTASVPAVSLVRLNRDHSSSEWETISAVALGI